MDAFRDFSATDWLFFATMVIAWFYGSQSVWLVYWYSVSPLLALVEPERRENPSYGFVLRGF